MISSVRSGAAKFKQLRHFTAATGCCLALAACASMPAPASPTARVESPPQPLERLRLPIPDSKDDLLAQLLAGEMALGRTDLPAAAGFYARAMLLTSDADVAERAAALAIAVHDAPAAARALDRWQSLGAKPAPLAQARAQLALDGGRTDDARQQLEILTDSGDKDAWRQFGRILMAARDQAQAALLLQDLATPRRLPADAQAWLAMSELGEKFGLHAYARQLASAAVIRFHSAEVYAWAAQMKFRDGDHDGARALLKEALARAPGNIPLRLAYAGMLSQAKDRAGAARLLEQGPQDADVYAMRAGLAAQANDRKALKTIYRQLQAAPEDVRGKSAYLLGQLAEMQHLNGEALAWYEQVGDDDSHAFDADLRSAVLLQSGGHSIEAHQLLERMQIDYIEQPAQLSQAYQVDAELYMREQKFPQAEIAFSRALQVMPDDPGLLYARGLAYAQAGQIDKAVEDFRRLLKIKPGDPDASNALGYTLADANRDLSEAERLIQVARAAKPGDPAIADSWGWLQYRQGHLALAAQVLRGAWAARKDADVGVHLGEVLWQQGRRQEASGIFEQVRRIDPGNASLSDALKRLHP